MTWILILYILMADGTMITEDGGLHATMVECQEAGNVRELVRGEVQKSFLCKRDG